MSSLRGAVILLGLLMFLGLLKVATVAMFDPLPNTACFCKGVHEMKRLRSAVIVLAVVASVGLAINGALSIGGTVSTSSCGGFKPETRTLCWRGLP